MRDLDSSRIEEGDGNEPINRRRFLGLGADLVKGTVVGGILAAIAAACSKSRQVEDPPSASVGRSMLDREISSVKIAKLKEDFEKFRGEVVPIIQASGKDQALKAELLRIFDVWSKWALGSEWEYRKCCETKDFALLKEHLERALVERKIVWNPLGLDQMDPREGDTKAGFYRNMLFIPGDFEGPSDMLVLFHEMVHAAQYEEVLKKGDREGLQKLFAVNEDKHKVLVDLESLAYAYEFELMDILTGGELSKLLKGAVARVKTVNLPVEDVAAYRQSVTDQAKKEVALLLKGTLTGISEEGLSMLVNFTVPMAFYFADGLNSTEYYGVLLHGPVQSSADSEKIFLKAKDLNDFATKVLEVL